MERDWIRDNKIKPAPSLVPLMLDVAQQTLRFRNICWSKGLSFGHHSWYFLELVETGETLYQGTKVQEILNHP